MGVMKGFGAQSHPHTGPQRRGRDLSRLRPGVDNYDPDPVVGPALRLRAVNFERDGRRILDRIDWEVEAGQRWVVLGPNGSGKTTLLRLSGGHDHPTEGTVEILGSRVGRVDLRRLRTRVGFTSGAVTRTLRATLPAADIVMTGRFAALEPWWHDYGDVDRARARDLLATLGVGHVAALPWAVISEGERQQVLLARLLMGDPELVLLDEPFAGLDLGARERLLDRLGTLFADPATPALVLVTHHVEEIPVGTTHAALLREGRVVAAGPVDKALTAATLSAAFALDVRLGRDGDRWWAHAGGGAEAPSP